MNEYIFSNVFDKNVNKIENENNVFR